ncbi:ABC transporter ATP-binding protein [Bifidobacterium felsineum]|uniref:ABC transporter ATP-binding protein n=1 Tax=Bifidobacterium felsineum TaxID=2045440 RepID=A0A2M9HIM1_9BIFI|nr:dipeptide/oligopeptide/nickel ABC transporter ATP-binding protein [Bifidobacterium felsineum]MBT1164895.1 ABC transporter ATP-binding protein [Bifidobacterium felsineum]PJM76631.1 ABC transporter ATP-binding protein [Bifidobacterium felsineum]
MTQHASPALFELRNITVRYGDFTAVDHVSLSLPRGGAIGVVGESGAGKSTLARVASGLIAPVEGQVLLDGQPLAPIRRTREQRRRIQMVFQNPDSSLNPSHSVYRILSEGMLLHHTLGARGARPSREIITRRCLELLSMVGLEDADILSRRPQAFSGGQRQRIAIARALAVNPDVLIADEPTSALDVSVQHEILDLLATLRQSQGLSLILITHDLGVANALCDDIMVMCGGNSIVHKPTAVFFTNPGPQYAQNLLAAARSVSIAPHTRG